MNMEPIAISHTLYIGAGLDFLPVIHLPKIKNFIFVDCLPRKDTNQITDLLLGTKKQDNKNNYLDCDKFIENLIYTAELYGFERIQDKQIELEKYVQKSFTCVEKILYKLGIKKISEFSNPTFIKLYNRKTGQNIKYYVSTEFPINLPDQLVNDIKKCSAIISGSNFKYPSSILKIINCPFTFYIYSGVKCSFDKNELDGSENDLMFLVLASLNKKEFDTVVKELYLIEKISGNTKLLTNFKDLV